MELALFVDLSRGLLPSLAYDLVAAKPSSASMDQNAATSELACRMAVSPVGAQKESFLCIETSSADLYDFLWLHRAALVARLGVEGCKLQFRNPAQPEQSDELSWRPSQT